MRLFPDLESLTINLVGVRFPETVFGILENMKNLRELTLRNFIVYLDQSKHVMDWLLKSIVKSAPGLVKLIF